MKSVANPNSLLQLAEQLEHPRLHRHVERARRLVGDQQLRVERERPRERRALALTARQLVRVPVAERRRQLHRLEQLVDLRSRAASASSGDAVHDERLGDALRRSSAAG